jgi:hypothetical protein
MRDKDFWKDMVKESAVLSPVDRISEVLFGLIMVLTFTGAISAATDGRQEIGELLWAALGCNVAWGLVDAIMYLMNVVTERGHAVKAITKIQKSSDMEGARNALRDEMQPLISHLTKDGEVDMLTERIKQLPEPTAGNLITSHDIVAGMQIFLLVFLCTLPVALPFGIFDDVRFAMRASNGVALVLLFMGGYKLAHYAGFKPLLTAVIYSAIGIFLVALTMALGG